jgi:uncharacterized membrane protein
MKKTIKLFSEALVGLVVLFIFSQALRIVWQLIIDAKFITEYIATGVISTFIIFLMFCVIALLLEAKNENR